MATGIVLSAALRCLSLPLLQRSLAPALREWDKCVKLVDDCSKKVTELARQMPYLQFLGSGRALPGDSGDACDALMRDCLCHVRAIEVSGLH